MTEEHRRNKSIITPCTLKYSLFLQIYQFLPFFFSQFFNLKNNITTVLTESCEIWTSTDIPNACRHIIVLYVSDTWTKLYMNNQYFVLYMTPRDNIVW